MSLLDTHLVDVGLAEDALYRRAMNPVLYKIRHKIRPYIDYELPILEYIQSFHRNWLDQYFMYSANVGSHTFYVLMLPLPAWCGSLNLLRDLVQVLGLGIFLTGVVKDMLNLPRPTSPPLKRLTMSHYTSKEYGCPSSHSANATSVSMVILIHTLSSELSLFWKSTVILITIGYWITLLLGRLYCGMHGLVDVLSGTLVGILTVFLRMLTKPFWDSKVLQHSSYWPLFIVGLYYSLIYFHPTPVEQCPCFEDTVAFIAVLMGLDLVGWTLASPTTSTDYSSHPVKLSVPKSLSALVLRFLIGVPAVVLWKTLAKPLATSLVAKLRPMDSNQQCFAFLRRTDTRIIVKFVVYGGIPFAAIFAKYIFEWLNI